MKQNDKNNKKKTLKEKVEKMVNLKKEEKKQEKELTCEEKILKLEDEVKELKTEKLRSLAEFSNFRKRKEQELIDARDRTISNFVLDLLPSIDNFEMSLKMTDNPEMFIKGVQMIHDNLISTLKEHKIIEFLPKVGENFDPLKHDPIVVEDEKAEPGKVLSIVKKGFIHKNKILRPSRVNVKKEEN